MAGVFVYSPPSQGIACPPQAAPGILRGLRSRIFTWAFALIASLWLMIAWFSLGCFVSDLRFLRQLP
jgi:hypothetical protein